MQWIMGSCKLVSHREFLYCAIVPRTTLCLSGDLVHFFVQGKYVRIMFSSVVTSFHGAWCNFVLLMRFFKATLNCDWKKKLYAIFFFNMMKQDFLCKTCNPFLLRSQLEASCFWAAFNWDKMPLLAIIRFVMFSFNEAISWCWSSRENLIKLNNYFFNSSIYFPF